MPLESGSSKEAISHNIETEMHHDKPQKQAIAIAMKKAGKSNQDAVYSHGGGYSASAGPGGEGDTKSLSENHGSEVSRLSAQQIAKDAETFGKAASKFLGKPVLSQMSDWTPENEGHVKDAEPEEVKCQDCRTKYPYKDRGKCPNCGSKYYSPVR
jgi:hypothetical protein